MAVGTLTLSDFLLARIAEDEEAARDAEGDWWGVGLNGDGTERFAALHNPTRVLAEVEAKRRIVERATLLIDSFQRTVNDESGAAWPDVNRREKEHAWAALYDLAGAYADHPDCRPEWRP